MVDMAFFRQVVFGNCSDGPLDLDPTGLFVTPQPSIEVRSGSTHGHGHGRHESWSRNSSVGGEGVNRKMVHLNAGPSVKVLLQHPPIPTITPGKVTMEAENHWVVEEHNHPKVNVQVPC